MKVFICWSGKTSHAVAEVLRDWLPYMIQSVKPFLSSGDIAKGARWNDVLASELKDTDFGIVCITPYNHNCSWLHFESGALSKAVDRSRVMPFLFHVSPSNLRGPLGQFQATTSNREEVFELVVGIHSQLKRAEQMEEERLRKTFDCWWPKLRDDLDKVRVGGDGETETGYPWLYGPGDLVKLEVDAKSKAIWVVTPSPLQDLKLTCVRDVVKRNIEKGVSYSFVMPSSGESNGVRRMLGQILGSHHSQIKIFEISSDLFNSLAVTHYILLDPDGGSAATRVLLELPTSQRDFWIEVEGEAVVGFVDRFRRMMQGVHCLLEGTGDGPHAVNTITGIAVETVAVVELDLQ